MPLNGELERSQHSVAACGQETRPDVSRPSSPIPLYCRGAPLVLSGACAALPTPRLSDFSRYAPFTPPASRSFGHGPKCQRGLLVGDTR
jgi:hypothetical protein